jgi:hypothetical protein
MCVVGVHAAATQLVRFHVGVKSQLVGELALIAPAKDDGA